MIPLMAGSVLTLAAPLVGASLLRSMATPGIWHRQGGKEIEISDSAILNFALNLEYLEAEFYSHAVNGSGLPDNLTDGTGQRGPVEGGREVPFDSRSIRQMATEIARDEHEHVEFFRLALGRGRPASHQYPPELFRRGNRGGPDQRWRDLRPRVPQLNASLVMRI
jgi:hypothetical protein